MVPTNDQCPRTKKTDEHSPQEQLTFARILRHDTQLGNVPIPFAAMLKGNQLNR
jgi:hypothetical protein